MNHPIRATRTQCDRYVTGFTHCAGNAERADAQLRICKHVKLNCAYVIGLDRLWPNLASRPDRPSRQRDIPLSGHESGRCVRIGARKPSASPYPDILHVSPTHRFRPRLGLDAGGSTWATVSRGPRRRHPQDVLTPFVPFVYFCRIPPDSRDSCDSWLPGS